MELVEFTLERVQSLYENTVDHNLSDSGVHPYSLKELLTEEERSELLDIELGYGWTNGGIELRNAVAALYKNRDLDNVMVTNGSAEANFILTMALLDPGDEIIIVVPNYLQMWGWAKSIGVTVKEVTLREHLGWQIDIDELRAAVTPKTKLISVCHPNNPTGSVMSEQQMLDLVALAREHDIYLHGDEIYKGSELDGNESSSVADLYEKGIATGGLSKALALPGLRVGWLVADKDLIYKTWQCKDYTSITTGAISEYIAERVIQPERREKILARSRKWLSDNVVLLDRWLSEHADTFSCCLPKAGGMAFLKYNIPVNSTELVEDLRKHHGILMVPGDAYGLDGYIRVGVGSTPEDLNAGLAELSKYTKSRVA